MLFSAPAPHVAHHLASPTSTILTAISSETMSLTYPRNRVKKSVSFILPSVAAPPLGEDKRKRTFKRSTSSAAYSARGIGSGTLLTSRPLKSVRVKSPPSSSPSSSQQHTVHTPDSNGLLQTAHPSHIASRPERLAATKAQWVLSLNPHRIRTRIQ